MEREMFLSSPRAIAFRDALALVFSEYDKLFPPSEVATPSKQYLMLMQEMYSPKHYHREKDIVLERAEGVWMWDTDGKRYLDANACYSAVALGYGNIELHGVLMRQGFRFTCAQNRIVNEWQPQLSKKLAEITGLDQAILKNAGTEAFDIAVKAVRRFGYAVKGIPEDSAEIITAKNNFHGRSLSAIAASSNEKYRSQFGPFPPGFLKVDYGDIQSLENQITPNTVAFIVEVIQGEGGIVDAPIGYFAAVRELCTRKGVLLIFDEIQTGLGRTGKLFASEWVGVRPDGVLLGKALGQEIPVSAFVSKNEVMDLLRPGSDGSTFAGTPLACALALKSIEMITRNNCAVVRNAQSVGAYFLEKLKMIGSPAIKEVRGKGLFIGIEFDERLVLADQVFVKLKENGLIAGVAGNNTVRLTPALIITRRQVDWAVRCIERTLRNFSF
jgi:ornithine--oxo-acid transaminase